MRFFISLQKEQRWCAEPDEHANLPWVLTTYREKVEHCKGGAGPSGRESQGASASIVVGRGGLTELLLSYDCRNGE